MQVQVNLVDVGNNGLLRLRSLRHVADIATLEESEKLGKTQAGNRQKVRRGVFRMVNQLRLSKSSFRKFLEKKAREMPVTHVFTYNGVSRLEVLSDQLAEHVVRRAPMLMDGQGEFAISLSRLPEGKRLRNDLPGSWADLFVQAAGSAAVMMIEVRKQNAGGSESLYRLARLLPEGKQSTGAADITWNGRVDRVPADEAFDAVEAGEIFWHYCQHDAVPQRYELRFLE